MRYIIEMKQDDGIVGEEVNNVNVLNPKIILESSKLKGVNFHSYGSARYQNNTETILPPPPYNYIDDSFRIFANNGITCVRIPFYWESWELDANSCYQDLNAIGEAADKYGVMCIYDNHQWECSSWMGRGIGMPNSLLSIYYQKRTGHVPDYKSIKDFWSRWWNRQISNAEGEEGWDAQLDYLKKIVKLLEGRKSTFGFEILNEPEVFSVSHYMKVGHYHEYIAKELREITDKPLLFCWALPHDVMDTSLLQALVRPKMKNNIIYDGHAYPPSVTRMLYFRSIVLLMGNIPVYMGEFNSGFKNGTILTESQIVEYIKRFKDFAISGWALWRWSYMQDKNISAFNLTTIVDNRIQPGIYFNYLLKATKDIE
jgi:hypothetical protein